jgi:hypothetical protein
VFRSSCGSKELFSHPAPAMCFVGFAIMGKVSWINLKCSHAMQQHFTSDANSTTSTYPQIFSSSSSTALQLPNINRITFPDPHKRPQPTKHRWAPPFPQVLRNESPHCPRKSRDLFPAKRDCDVLVRPIGS